MQEMICQAIKAKQLLMVTETKEVVYSYLADNSDGSKTG